MSHLYVNANGREVKHGSSSSLDLFRTCRRKFRLSRIDGWKEKGEKGSLAFGKCIEDAVQFFYDNGCKPGDAVDTFKMKWLKFAEVPMTYTDQEGGKDGFKDLYIMGSEMMRLFEAIYQTLPIRNPKWQLQYLKKVFPGTDYDDLEFMAYVDCLSTLEDGSRLIIDIKTAKSQLPVTSNMMALDGQLRKYAWVSGVKAVAFLNFVKASNPDSFMKGTNVCLLDDSLDWKAGTPLVVARFQAPKPYIPASEGVKEQPEVPWSMLVGPEETVQIMDKAIKEISGKGSKERTEQLFTEYLASGKLCSVQRDQVTKTRIQFVKGEVPEEDLPEIGDAIGRDLIQIAYASQQGCFPQDGGVRFPNNSCTYCSFRGVCLKDQNLIDTLLVNIKAAPAIKEDDWLTELETEEVE